MGFSLLADPLAQVFTRFLRVHFRVHLHGESGRQHLQEAVDEVLVFGHVGTSGWVISQTLVPDNNLRFNTLPCAGILGLLHNIPPIEPPRRCAGRGRNNQLTPSF